jgi:hypothetical protein
MFPRMSISDAARASGADSTAKLMFRDRNQMIKRTLLHLGGDQTSSAVSSAHSIGANSRSTSKIAQVWFSRTGQFAHFRVFTPISASKRGRGE